MDTQVLITVFKRYLIWFFIFAVIAILAILVSRGEKKWIFSIVIVCTIGVAVVFSVLIGQTVADTIMQDFVTLENATLVCESATVDNYIGGCCSVTIISEDGLEFGLLSSTIIDAGTYKGTVVYAKRSKIIMSLEVIDVP